MPGFHGPLPEPESAFDEKVLADVREYGWHCIRVDPAAHPEHRDEIVADELPADASFAYTVGVSLALGHPEIILVGPWTSWHGIISQVVRLIESERRFEPGDQTTEVLGEYAVRFGAVSSRNRKQLLTYADWATFRRGFEAVQLILPDGNSRWPDDPDYASFEQPLLAS